MTRDDRLEKRSRTWHPRQKWSVVEAATILREPTPYMKSLAKAIIGLDWEIAWQSASRGENAGRAG